MQFLTTSNPFRYKSNAAQINNVLARIQNDWQRETPKAHANNFRTPPVDILEFDDAYSLEVELPGVDKEAINITVEDGVLTIAAGVGVHLSVGADAEKTEDSVASETEGQTLRRERYQGKVTRQFSLGEHVDENTIEANLENGVLKIRIAKLAEAEPKARQIEVK